MATESLATSHVPADLRIFGLTHDRVFNCALPSWYPQFKRHTITSIILPVPPEFRDYLLDDGSFILPAWCDEMRTRLGSQNMINFVAC